MKCSVCGCEKPAKFRRWIDGPGQWRCDTRDNWFCPKCVWKRDYGWIDEAMAAIAKATREIERLEDKEAELRRANEEHTANEKHKNVERACGTCLHFKRSQQACMRYPQKCAWQSKYQ